VSIGLTAVISSNMPTDIVQDSGPIDLTAIDVMLMQIASTLHQPNDADADKMTSRVMQGRKQLGMSQRQQRPAKHSFGKLKVSLAA
jgi:hypothetical protein